MNSVEIGKGQVKWGRGDGYRMGPTNARNFSKKKKKCEPVQRIKNMKGNYMIRYWWPRFQTFDQSYRYAVNKCKSLSRCSSGWGRGRCKTVYKGGAEQKWDGLGRLGSCNSKYAKFKLIKTDKGDKFRLQREAFTGGYSVDKDGNVKEGYHWNKGSRKSQIPGRGFYMGMKENRNNWAGSGSEWDRLYSSEKGTVHKFDCDYNPRTAEKRVGLFTCRGGSKNGKKFPFKTNAAYCDHIDPLRESGYTDSQLVCKEGCEPYGGTCEGPKPGLVYHIEMARPYNKVVYAMNKRWWWSNAKCILGNDNNPTGKVIGGTLSNWYNRARNIPNIKTRAVKINYYGKDQGWGNPTSWVRLILWSGNKVIYNKDVGGRDCWRSGNCVSRGWKWNRQEIPYTEFTTKKESVITKALIVVREMGSGHRAWIKQASIEFNPQSGFSDPENAL